MDPVDAEPFTGCDPVHAPDASQEDAFDEVHVKVDATPCVTLVGLARNETSGAGVPPTVTETDALATPPGPEHESE